MKGGERGTLFPPYPSVPCPTHTSYYYLLSACLMLVLVLVPSLPDSARDMGRMRGAGEVDRSHTYIGAIGSRSSNLTKDPTRGEEEEE